MKALLTTTMVAERLGISARRIRALIKLNRLPAIKAGRDWIIDEADLIHIAERKPGWQAGRKRS